MGEKQEIKVRVGTIFIILILFLVIGFLIYNNVKLQSNIESLGAEISDLKVEKEQAIEELNTIKNNTSNKGNQNIANETSENSNYSWIVEPKLEYDRIIWIRQAEFNYQAKSYEGELIGLDPDAIMKGLNGERTPHSGGSGGGIVVYDGGQQIWGCKSYDTGNVDILSTIKEAKNATDSYQKQGDIFPVSSITIEKSNQYESIRYTEDYKDNQKYAYASENKLITDFIFDNIDELSDTKTPAVCKNGKWGFINEKGEQIISYEFDGAISIETGKAFVKQNGKWGIIQIKI